MIQIDEQTTYIEYIEEQRRLRVKDLMKDYGFLTLAGLYWLAEGENRFGCNPGTDSGTDSGTDIILPPNTAPDFCGTLTLSQGKVTIEVADAVEMVTAAGEKVTKRLLQGDHSGAPDMLYLNNLAMLLLERGDRYAIRLYDKENQARKDFDGLDWYPVDPTLRIVADFAPHEQPTTLTIVETYGYVYEAPSPGIARFQWQGREVELVAEDRGTRLFYNFRDPTNNETTYGAGRFLFSDLPQEGKVLLDFNLATNPYCAYSHYAVCPLPPNQNRLDFAVNAGEKNFESHHS